MTPARRREAWSGLLFISPWIIGFLVFTAFPLAYSLYISFTDYSGLTEPNWVGLENYTRAVTGADPLIVKSIMNTLWYVAIMVPGTIIVSLGLAMLLLKPLKGISVFRTLFYVPVVVPIVSTIAVMMWIFHGEYGLVNSGLRLLGIDGPGWLTDPAWTKWVIVAVGIWTVGGSMVIFLAGLQSIPPHLYEAASLDGAGPVRQFWHITVPMLSPIIFFNTVMAVIASFQVFVPALLLGTTTSGGYKSSGGPGDSLLFYVLYIYQNGFQFFEMGFASALSWLLCIVVLATTVVMFKVGNRLVYYESR